MIKLIFFAILLVALFIGTTYLLVDQATNSYHSQTILFTDMSEAREFQKKCLEKEASHVTVTEMVTGVQITCRWFKQ